MSIILGMNQSSYDSFLIHRKENPLLKDRKLSSLKDFFPLLSKVQEKVGMDRTTKINLRNILSFDYIRMTQNYKRKISGKENSSDHQNPKFVATRCLS